MQNVQRGEAYYVWWSGEGGGGGGGLALVWEKPIDISKQGERAEDNVNAAIFA